MCTVRKNIALYNKIIALLSTPLYIVTILEIDYYIHIYRQRYQASPILHITLNNVCYLVQK